jgi:hypothetical protein
VTLRRQPLAEMRCIPYALAKRTFQKLPMTCPACKGGACRRSRRRSVSEYLVSAAGVVPWRCTTCETRFHARAIPLRHLLYARCGVCGNLELQRIGAEKVLGVTSVVGRLLGLPAARCVPCRHNFFSLRPMLPAEQLSALAAQDGAAKY